MERMRLFLLFLLVLLFAKLVKCQNTFSMTLSENVRVVNTLSATATCLNTTVTTKTSSSKKMTRYKLLRGVLTKINYEKISPLGEGETRISIQVEFRCCPFYCNKISQDLAVGKWDSGSITMDIVEETTVGIYYNGEQVCHSSYLKGIFGQTVSFSPFVLEGKGDECIISKDNQKIKVYKGSGRAIRMAMDEVGSNKIAVHFAFSVTSWSKEFLLKFMREGEHEALANVDAEVVVFEEYTGATKVPSYGIYFMALAGFAYGVVLLAVIILICMRTRRGFLEQTWKTYDAYVKMKAEEANDEAEGEHTLHIAMKKIVYHDEAQGRVNNGGIFG
eukprot:Seg1883.3 transcript_id=Seg1883.3/GoldUCD/mRNA.D3Y31 product="hypothetical protein" protein_id=Seg1883.3/GoldUCD/D3Y31